ncbi:MAG: AAA family ATPase [Microscillaceae bacterium]|nr:AAA family ATPase [Microscillaceae bacterium]
MTKNIIEDSPQLYHSSAKTEGNVFPKNLILYGPPGTGKTYETIHYALAIIEHKTLAQIQSESREVLMNRYQKYQKDGQIAFVTFHPSYAYEDFVQGIKPNTQVGNLVFEKKDGIFKILADRALKNYEGFTRQKNQVSAPFEDLLNLLLSYKINPETEEIEIPLDSEHRIYKSIIIFDLKEDALVYRRRTKNDIVKDESRQLTLAKLSALYQGREIKEAINEKYYQAVVEAVKTHTEDLKKEDEDYELKNYVLIIDEINRANIAQVFGELLSLLEDDKRYKSQNQLVVTLSSGEDLTVPPNLYLVGTMNTADKSIALLDYALRRRFNFQPFYPREDLIADGFLSNFLRKLNAALLQEKRSDDFLIGHAFLMGFSQNDLAALLEQKIIPLLSEYFLNRKDKIIKILALAGVEVEEIQYELKFKKIRQD